HCTDDKSLIIDDVLDQGHIRSCSQLSSPSQPYHSFSLTGK
ncbi:hypothetical protein A2U01_0059406, partial [Trifolium medium]|nr:hypothetical protein [Trifolium medium]